MPPKAGLNPTLDYYVKPTGRRYLVDCKHSKAIKVKFTEKYLKG